jgi:dUTP pyrophosphatase
MINKEEAKNLVRKIHEDTYKIEVEVLEGGFLPSKKNPKDAGFDLMATEDILLYPGQVIKHPLNIKLKLPVGSWGQIETKSGLGVQGQLVYAGVIDEEYRGIPHVIMTNLKMKVERNILVKRIDENTGEYIRELVDNDEPIVIKKGQKLAQLTMNPHSTEFYVVQVDKVDTNTTRSEGGFGSTGLY